MMFSPVMLTSMTCGLFITIEGGSTLDRNTQVRRLTMRLRSHGIEAFELPELSEVPGSAAIMNLLRGPFDQWSPEAEALLMLAAYNDRLEKVIRPTVQGGRWIIGVGFADATRALHCARSEAATDWAELLDDAVAAADRPNLTFILEGGGAARLISKDGSTSFKDIGGVDERFRERLLDIARRDPERCCIVDPADGNDIIAETIWSTVRLYSESRPSIDTLDMHSPAY